MNIPGPVKQSPPLHAAFCGGAALLRQQFGAHLLAECEKAAVTGSELLLALDLPPEAAKRQTVRMENSHPLGRLFDLDVLDPCGRAVSRVDLGLPPRRCLLCGQDAKVCGRSRAHSVGALQARISALLDGCLRGGEEK